MDFPLPVEFFHRDPGQYGNSERSFTSKGSLPGIKEREIRGRNTKEARELVLRKFFRGLEGSERLFPAISFWTLCFHFVNNITLSFQNVNR